MKRLERLVQTKWFPLCVFIGLTFLLYGNSLFYDLTFLDDNVWLSDYRWFINDLSRLPHVFTQNDVLFGQLYYRPLIYTSFILDSQWIESGYLSYHWTNLWIHIANVTLVFYLLRVFAFQRLDAFWGSVLFCVHPTLVSAVVWIPGRTDSLFALFLFSSLLCFILWTQKKKNVLLFAHLVTWGLALLTKETAVMGAVLFGFYVFTCQDCRKNLKRFWFLPLIWISLLGVYFFLRQIGIHEKYDQDLGAMILSAWSNLPALVSYFGKTLFPLNLSVLPYLRDLPLRYGFLVMVILGVSLFQVKERRGRMMIFGLVWFFLFIFPALIFAQYMYEYRLCVPLFGFLLVALELLKNQRQRAGVYIFFSVLFIVLSFSHSRHYQDRFAFWMSAVQTSPHAPLAQRNLGTWYHQHNDLDQAEVLYLKTLELNPKEEMCFNNLGLIYEHRGEYKKAEEAYLNEIAINPYYDLVHYNLGLFYYKRGYEERALQLWKRTIALNPRYVAAYQHLIGVYFNRGEMDQARQYARALEHIGGKIPVEVQKRLNM